jgi:beta propeller repeat protein
MQGLDHNNQGTSIASVRSKASRICIFVLLSVSLVIIAATTGVLPSLGGPLSNSTPAFAQASVTGAETQITSDDGPQFNSQISGDNIVYTDSSSGSAEIYYYDIQSDSVHSVSDLVPGDQQLSDISDSYIVFTNYSSGAGDIWLYEIASETLTNITPEPADQSYPAVSDEIIAWEDSRGVDRDIWIYDISTQEYRDITGAGNQDSPAVSGDRIVYRDGDEHFSIKLYDASSDTTTTIFQGTTDAEGTDPSIDGDFVTFAIATSSSADIAVHNINTGDSAVLTTDDVFEINPSISGDWVSFEQHDPSTGSHVVLWHWTVGNNPETDTFLITPATSQQTLNDIDANRVTYTDNRDSNLDIFVYEFTEEETPPTTWTIEGFYAPVDMNGVVNTIRSGQAVALKFEVFDENGQELTDTAIVESLTQKKISCTTLQGEPTDAIEEPITNVGNTQLTYDQDAGQFIQHWKTPPRQPNTCWEVKLTTTDDSSSSISAYFRLR